MSIFEAIKTKDLEKVIELAKGEERNAQDTSWRTPLHVMITHKCPANWIEAYLQLEPNLEIKDKLGETVLSKAIKFRNSEVVELLIQYGAQLNHPKGIRYTPWYQARYDKKIADLLIETEDAFRLTLTKQEQSLIDELLYEESAEILMRKLKYLNSPELIHAYVTQFNWDDDLWPLKWLLHNRTVHLVTTMEMYDLLGVSEILENTAYRSEEAYQLALKIIDQLPRGEIG
ncbi:ankyrin repeat domain-containing protein [Bacillus sp. Hm123]|uniref:ankyrin repeat domain-containing protein n=1 Tax=Bacillus sp. Hm123 TaxID=3450745 RepID=UPI003F4250EE